MLCHTQELIDSAKNQLTGNHKTLKSLEHRSGNTASGTNATYEAFIAAIAEWDSSLALPQNTGELVAIKLLLNWRSCAILTATRQVQAYKKQI